jgi:hypothetical protein
MGRKTGIIWLQKLQSNARFGLQTARITLNPVLFAKPAWGPEQKKETNV